MILPILSHTTLPIARKPRKVQTTNLLEHPVPFCLLTRWCRFDVPRQQPPESLDENEIRDTRWSLGQAEVPDAEKVVQGNAGEDLCVHVSKVPPSH